MEQDKNLMPVKTETKTTFFDNPISSAVIIGAFVVALSVIAGAYIVRGNFSSSSSGVAQANPDAKPTTDIKVAVRNDAPFIGNPNAPVTMYEFGDFQCPFCKKFYTDTFAQLKTQYIDTGKVKLVFRHFPLNQIHVNAQISSEAAECANRQGQFEAYYTILYTKGQGDGNGLDANSLKGYAKQLGLNTQNFNACLDNHEARDVVAKDLALGTSLGIEGTPSFIINGTLVVGALPFANISQTIDAVLKK
jgi:protein-disulfide isomerase